MFPSKRPTQVYDAGGAPLLALFEQWPAGQPAVWDSALYDRGSYLHPENFPLVDSYQMLNLRMGGFEQFREIVDIGSARVADHEIAKSTLAPGCYVERQLFCHGRTLVPSRRERAFLEHEHGNFVFPHGVDQVCAR